MRPITLRDKQVLGKMVDQAVEYRVQLDLLAIDLSKKLGCDLDTATDCINNCDSVSDLLDMFGIEVLLDGPAASGPPFPPNVHP